jgi:hypothetical protein
MSDDEFVTKTPLMAGRPRINPTIFEQVGDLCKAQSLALTNWMGVEDTLCNVFKAAMRSPDDILPYAALSAVQFDAKVRIVDMTLQEALREHPDALETWHTLKNKIARVTKFRNLLAHSRLEIFGDNIGMTWRLYPASSNISGLRKAAEAAAKGSVLDEKRVASFICSFQLLTKRLGDYAKLVEELLPSPDKP